MAFGLAVMLGGPFLSLYLFAACPAIPHVLDCSLAGSLGRVLFEVFPVVGAVVAVLGLFWKETRFQSVDNEGAESDARQDRRTS